MNALSRWNPSHRIYAGIVFRSDVTNQFGRFVRPPMRPYPRASGGALYVLSKPVLRWFASAYPLYYDHELRNEALGVSDDLGLGTFISLVGGVTVSDMPGIWQLPRFGPPGGGQGCDTRRLWSDPNASLPRCPCPLPPPVMAGPGLFPRVPLAWPSIVALHASPEAWPVLDQLEWRRTMWEQGHAVRLRERERRQALSVYWL